MPLLIDRLHTDDEELRRVQDRIIAAVNPALLLPLLGGRIVEGVKLNGGGVVNDVQHKLERKPTGWAVVRKYAVTEGPVARYRSSAAHAVADATAYVVGQFNTKDEDTHNAVTTGAAWQFKAPMEGLYAISASVFIDTAAFAGGYAVFEMWFRTNTAGAGYVTSRVASRAAFDTAAGAVVGLAGSQQIRMAKDVLLEVALYQSTGASRNTYHDGVNPTNTVSIVRLAEGPDLWDVQADLSDDFKTKFLRLKSQFNMTIDLWVF